jgi:hypothetical protein
VEKIGDMAGSFGRVAETYDRVRPGPAPAAVDWLIPAGCGAAVDLAAGTGLFTKALLDLLRLSAVPGQAREREAGEPRTADQVREKLDRHHSVTPPPDAPFGRAEAESFTFTRMMDVDDVVDWLATNSGFITAPAAGREAGLARCRTALLAQATGDSRVEMPLRSWCWRADRLPRVTERSK